MTFFSALEGCFYLGQVLAALAYLEARAVICFGSVKKKVEPMPDVDIIFDVFLLNTIDSQDKNCRQDQNGGKERGEYG
jgi:hypothetical protein